VVNAVDALAVIDGGGERADRAVAVIGGGWAGCAAALELARVGHRVALHESSAAFGGRARCVLRDGLALDNGQHLLLGACNETLDLARRLAADHRAPPWTRSRFAILPLWSRQANALSLSTRGLPAPFGLALGMLCARGLSVADRLATLRWLARLRRSDFRVAPGATVAALFERTPAQARRRLWEPLCLAALNTPAAAASAQVFADVLRATFAAGKDGADLVVPSAGLAEFLPEPAVRRLRAAGHMVLAASTAQVRDITLAGVAIDVEQRQVVAPAAIVAVGPHQLASAFDAGLVARHPAIAEALRMTAGLRYAPVTTIYLGYAAALPLPQGLVRLDDAPGQWVFDRADILARAAAGGGPEGGNNDASGRAPPDGIQALLAVVISGNRSQEESGHAALVAAADGQLRRLHCGVPQLRWSQVIVEKRATYVCTPGLMRPRCGRLADRVYLAGDYTCQELPATLEAAVRSGIAAARALSEDFAACAPD
jgi:squalene-associated FAD-dependent desaturase